MRIIRKFLTSRLRFDRFYDGMKMKKDFRKSGNVEESRACKTFEWCLGRFKRWIQYF